MEKKYGYCRISTKQQNIERQIRNILSAYPDADIRTESYTGTKIDGRKELEKILKEVKKGDTIIFDSVSRMSRNAEEGFKLYQELYQKGVELVFLKEPHINTTTYKKALESGIELTGTKVDLILSGVNAYLMELAKEQIKIAFEQSEKEVMDLRQRTKEGIETARRNGKQIGQAEGKKFKIKKAAPAKEKIKKYSRDFDGTLPDAEVMKLVGLARNTYYKYKKELKEE
mgnify:FL=1